MVNKQSLRLGGQLLKRPWCCVRAAFTFKGEQKLYMYMYMCMMKLHFHNQSQTYMIPVPSKVHLYYITSNNLFLVMR